ncbi:neogenin [Trichonephila clavipes]|nr:neogenin [Trichonephila clavipes]
MESLVIQLDLDSRFRIVGSGSLAIENVQEEDAGIYMCRAVNSEDSVDANTNINILVPPYFITKPTNQYAREKDDITFNCDVYGNPVPILRWYKNSDIIVHSDYFQIVNGKSLRILGAVKSDSGIYQCFATNSAGSIQSSAELEVLDAVNLVILSRSSKEVHSSIKQTIRFILTLGARYNTGLRTCPTGDELCFYTLEYSRNNQYAL